MRVFVRLREMLAANRQMAAKIYELETRLDTHDSTIQELIEAIEDLMMPDDPPRHRIGFPTPAGQNEAVNQESTMKICLW